MATATNPLPVELAKGNFAVVEVGDLRVRSQPGVGEGSTKYAPTLPAGATLLVVGGPTYADGYWWYQVHFKPGLLAGATTEGWVAAGTREGQPWISYADVDPGCDPAVGCPSPSADPKALSPVGLRLGEHAMTIVDDLRVRSAPFIGDASIKYVPTLPRGTDVHVLSGPRFVDGYWWYKVELTKGILNGGVTIGWIPAADKDGTPWVENVDDFYGCDIDPSYVYQPGDMPC